MRHYCKISSAVTLALVLLIQSGCQEQAKAPVAAELVETETRPEITFEKTTYDFGEVTAGKRYSGEFKFTNAGDGLLKIINVKKCCGVVATLDKKEPAPGESGTLKVEYNTGWRSGLMSRELSVYSNDKTNPKVVLTIKAQIVIRVDYQPQRIDLLLNQENAGCPKIKIRSLDKQPFSITSFQSTGDDTITADIDPSAKATEFVIEPNVDLDKLQKKSAGRVSISLTHTEFDKVSIPFRAKPRFQLTPTGVFLLNPRPLKPNINKVSIVSNYGEEFEIASASSEKGMAKVVNQQAIKGGYRLEIEITPPPRDVTNMFTDVVNVHLKGGQTLAIKCYVRYLSKEKT